mgnify:FL=1
MVNIVNENIKVKVIKPRIGRTCVCPVCHMRQPLKKIVQILELLKI